MLSTCHSCDAPLGPTARVCLQCGTLRATTPANEPAPSAVEASAPNEMPAASSAETGVLAPPPEEGQQAVEIQGEAPLNVAQGGESLSASSLAAELPRPFQVGPVAQEDCEPLAARATAAPGLDLASVSADEAPGKKGKWIAFGAVGVGFAAIGTALAFYIVSQHPVVPVMRGASQTGGIAHSAPPPAPAAMDEPPPPIVAPAPPVSANQAFQTDGNPAATSTVDLPVIQAAYQRSIQSMNALWHTLPLDVQHSLLPSQRAWIKDKVQDCRARTSALPATGDVQEAARLQCEMQRDQERLRQLAQYRANVFMSGSDGDASGKQAARIAPQQSMGPSQNPADQIVRQTITAARACYAQQNYDCAEADANTVLRIDPSSADAQMLLQAIRRKRQDALQSNWNAH